MNNSKKAFSFVEIIITLAIIVLLATVWLVANKNYKDSADNSKSISDIKTITNALESYLQEKKELPLPKWNNNFFKEDSSYAHSYTDSETFWVHGFITEDTLPKKYLNILPLDPKTNQYYAYGKTKNTNFYELAWINWIDSVPESFIEWNYTAETWPYNLIREYNWPNFVSDKSRANFPFNPEENILVGRIDDFTWAVVINNDITSVSEIFNHVLVKWDKIIVPAWWFANIYFSDWTISALWDATWVSELVLSEMSFKEDNNLFTNIKLALTSWTIWNKATDLNDESSFEITTTDATAAVRWTIFWVHHANGTNFTNITVKEWIVKVTPIPDKNKNTLAQEKIIEATWGIEQWVTISSNIGTSNTSSTWAINSAPNEVKESVIDNDGWEVTENNKAELLEYSKNDTVDVTGIKYKITLKLNKSFRKAEFVKIVFDKEQFVTKNNYWKDNSTDRVVIELTGTEVGNNTSAKVYFWKNTRKGERLSKGIKVNLIEYSYSLRPKSNNTVTTTNTTTPVLESQPLCTWTWNFEVWTNKECSNPDASLTNSWYTRNPSQ